MRHLTPASRWAAWLVLSYALATPVAGAGIDRVHLMALAKSVLKVEAMKARGGFALGTAVSVAPGRFVTSCHVTRDADMVVVVQGGARWRASAERADLFLDLCLLRVPGLESVSPIPLSSAQGLRPGDEVAAAGYTGGAGLQMHAGVVNALHDLSGSKVIQTTTAFTSGASGGALFDADGRLVGILTFRLRGADGYYFAAPVDWIAGSIDDDAGYVAVAPLTGPQPFWAQPLDKLPFFMQAASLEVDQRWTELLALTDRWIGSDHSDPESWFMRGNSYAQLDRTDRAAEAFRQAVELDPRYGRAWLDLGKAYLKLGATDDVRRVALILHGLDATLADELATLMMRRAR